MITAKDAFEKVQHNIKVEADAILYEIDKDIEDLIQEENDPVFEHSAAISSYLCQLVEKTLIDNGYTVTKSDEDEGKILINIGWQDGGGHSDSSDSSDKESAWQTLINLIYCFKQ